QVFPERLRPDADRANHSHAGYDDTPHRYSDLESNALVALEILEQVEETRREDEVFLREFQARDVVVDVAEHQFDIRDEFIAGLYGADDGRALLVQLLDAGGEFD